VKEGKIIVILGQTAAGKTNLAVKLAKKFKGEIISADSRQVYRGLNIGTDKVTRQQMKRIPHHLLDVTSPKKAFTIAEYKKLADNKIKEILERGKLPIIAGGTGFYIQAIVDNIAYPSVPPNQPLRKKLEKLSAKQLLSRLKKLDPKRAKNIDPQNKRRLIRAIEIAKELGFVPQLPSQKGKQKYQFLQIGLKVQPEILKARIRYRLLKNIKKGLRAETKSLHHRGVSWKRMEELGLYYAWMAKFIRNKISRREMFEGLVAVIWQYAKRQKTWFQRDKRIKWFDSKDYKKIEKKIKRFLK